MQINILEEMKDLSDEELIDILRNQQDYQKKAVFAAVKIIEDRGLKDLVVEILTNEQEKEENTGKIVDFDVKNELSFHPGSPAQLEFERELLEKNIKFYRQEKVHWGTIPGVSYFFSNENFLRASNIYKHTKLYDEELPKTKPRTILKFYKILFLFITIGMIVLAIYTTIVKY